MIIFAENKMFFIAKLKAAFRHGENHKRAKVLKAIMESIHKEYSESNYYTNLYWIVGQLLLNDPEFRRLANKLDTECIKKGLADVVDSCIHKCSYVYPGDSSP